MEENQTNLRKGGVREITVNRDDKNNKKGTKTNY
jgi:hypothetical protein